MQTAWDGIRAGLGDLRWAIYFAAWLFPALAVAVLLAWWCGWDMTREPEWGAWLLVALATCVSLFAAGVWDGPEGRLGRHVWPFVVVAFVFSHAARLVRGVILYDIGHAAGTQILRLAGYRVIVNLTVTSAETVETKQTNWTWRDAWRLRFTRAEGALTYRLQVDTDPRTIRRL